MTRRWRPSIPVVVGVLNVLFALAGLAYNTMMFVAFRSLGFRVPEVDAPHFEAAFKVMSAVCVSFYLALAVSGVQLVRRRLGWAYLAIATLALESAYFFAMGAAWALLDRPVAMSVGAATGVSSGGLMPQFVVLYPIWGIAALVLVLARPRAA